MSAIARAERVAGHPQHGAERVIVRSCLLERLLDHRGGRVVSAALEQQASVVAEGVGVVGVGGEGALVVLFGAAVVAAYVLYESRVVAEVVGVVGVGGEGALVVPFGAVVVAAYVGEEERVVAEVVDVVGVGC